MIIDQLASEMSTDWMELAAKNCYLDEIEQAGAHQHLLFVLVRVTNGVERSSFKLGWVAGGSHAGDFHLVLVEEAGLVRHPPVDDGAEPAIAAAVLLFGTGGR